MTKKLKECLLELAEQKGITIRFGQSDTAKNKSSVPDQDKKQLILRKRKDKKTRLKNKRVFVSAFSGQLKVT